MSTYFFLANACAPKKAATIPATAIKYTPAMSPNILAAWSSPITIARITNTGYNSIPASENQAIAL